MNGLYPGPATEPGWNLASGNPAGPGVAIRVGLKAAETATSTAAAAASHHLRFKIFICCPSPPAGPEHRGRRPVTALSRLPLVGVRGGPGSYPPPARKRITEKRRGSSRRPPEATRRS